MTHVDGLGLAELTHLVQSIAADTTTWRRVVRFDPAHRYYVRLHSDSQVDVWLLTWLHDQSTDLHDHGSSAAAFTVVQGELREVRAAADSRLSIHRRQPGETTWVAPGVVHDVRHSTGPAISIHAYSPPLVTMTYYQAHRGRLKPIRTLDAASPEFEGAGDGDGREPAEHSPTNHRRDPHARPPTPAAALAGGGVR